MSDDLIGAKLAPSTGDDEPASSSSRSIVVKTRRRRHRRPSTACCLRQETAVIQPIKAFANLANRSNKVSKLLLSEPATMNDKNYLAQLGSRLRTTTG